jgi:hypothetical protein
MATSIKQIRDTARILGKIIDLQIDLSDKTFHDVIYQLWPLGYCAGAFEAMAVHLKLDAEQSSLLATAGFSELFGRDDGPRHVKRLPALQSNAFFSEGRDHGADDFRKWIASRDFRPLALMNYFMFGRPAALKE